MRGLMARLLRGVLQHGTVGLADGLAVATAYVLATGVRLGGRIDSPEHTGAAAVALAAGALQVLCNIAFDVYWREWAVAAFEDVVALAKASVIVALALAVLNLVSPDHFIPNGALLPGVALALVLQTGLHLRPRWQQIAYAALARGGPAEGAIVVGSGRVGQLLARDLDDGSRGTRILCFADDDPARLGRHVRDVRVAGTVDDLPALIARLQPAVIVIAAERPDPELVRRVLERCRSAQVRVRAVSGFGFERGDRSILRPIDIEELLQRAPVPLDSPEARSYLAGKRVVVTGAAGSIGSELARRAFELAPDRVVLLDNAETGLHDVRGTLPSDGRAIIALTDLRDEAALGRALARERPDVVFHAAAYKHVPILEEQPLAALATNVLGTANLLRAAVAADVPSVVFISTDKAVDPANVLGLTKRFGELLTIAYAAAYRRRFVVVRFGNVLGSSGSVVPVFARQIDAGGPLTVTHPEATRFFMTIPEAAGLVIEAAAIAVGGEVFVLDMGAAVPIVELARNMVWLRGLRVPDDIAIDFVGLRPGERLHEALFSPEETVKPTTQARIRRATGGPIPSLAELEQTVARIRTAVATDDAESALSEIRRTIGGAVVVQRSF